MRHNLWTLARAVMGGVLIMLGGAALIRGEIMMIHPGLFALGAWSAAALIWNAKED